ncbi:MAG: hypothetical protein A4E28_02923 [Methanocella sp. PtaU1.Bin125]|nr:MAG: hypothetical protein A4E28_02923 [Methanocella sp. PtaU1.Bin125]
MAVLDTFTKEKIEKKVDVIFKDIRKAETPEDVVPLLVELSDFIDGENLTPQQLEELRGIGARAMHRHSRMEFLNDFGALISIVTASMIAGGAITGIYLVYSTGILEPLSIVLLLPLALLPLYLFYYGKNQKWFH